MKNSLFLILTALTMINSKNVVGQINLVPNPSFEDTLGCPVGVPDLDGKCRYWQSFRITPDYFNNCNSNVGFYNPWGYQQAHTGNAYAGFANYQVTTPNGKEQLGVQLLNQLTIGTKYYISYYLTSAYTPLLINIGTNMMGARLTTYSYYQPAENSPLPNSSIHHIDSVLSDTVNWTKFFGSFIADSSYTYLILGGFYEDFLIDTVHLPFSVIPQASYYFIDDVCLSTDSIYALNWTDIIKSPVKEHLIIKPTLFNEKIEISSDIPIGRIQLFEVSGKKILEQNSNQNETVLILSELSNGVYIIKIINSFYSKSNIIIKTN